MPSSPVAGTLVEVGDSMQAYGGGVVDVMKTQKRYMKSYGICMSGYMFLHSKDGWVKKTYFVLFLGRPFYTK